MKVLICGNGNLTRKDGGVFSHNEICKFLQQCVDLGLEIGYATIVLDDKDEKIKNLSNSVIPGSVHLELFHSFSQANAIYKLFLLPVIAFHVLSIIFKYDFLYCYYPGAIASILIRAVRVFHKKYGLYVRGELKRSKNARKDIMQASFIFATGISSVKSFCPGYSNCYEVAPMSNAFRMECISEPRKTFHTPLRGLFVGRVSEEKGVYELLEAMKILKERSIPVTMNFVGAYNSDFLQAAKAANLEDRITLSGLTQSNEELQRHYNEADFFCLPTWTEGFPRVLYEAMSYSLPCITTLVGGIPSRMHDGENCIAIKVKNPDSIVSAILALVENPDKLVSLSKASCDTFQYWKEFFSDQTHAKQLYTEMTTLNSRKTQ